MGTKRFLVAVLAALTVLGPTTAMAIPRDPLDPPELPDPPFVAPPGGFTWSVPANFGPLNADGIVDYRWNEVENGDHPGPQYSYDPNYVRPTARTASFDGCPTQAEADATTTTYNYTWSVHDLAGTPLGGSVTQRNCRWTRDFGLDPVTGEATPVKVRLAVTNPATGAPYPGYTAPKTFDEQVVHVKDLLIVSIGDSYGSGEGAPDKPQIIDGLGFVTQEARWVDRRCHRSAAAPSAVAARQLESADPHSTVTFLSFACSGATVSQEYFADQSNFDPYRLGQFTKPKGNGILGPYMGVEPPDPNDFSVEAKLPSQIDQLANALTNFGTAPARSVDALSISAGGNDMGFGPIASVCTLYWECENHFVSSATGSGPIRLEQRFNQSVGTMPARYAALEQALDTLPIERKYITQYPDPTRAAGGGACPKILDDVIPMWMAPFLAAAAALDFSPVPLPPYQMDAGDGEVDWASTVVLPGINGAVRTGATTQGWTLVDGIADSTANLFSGRGYCASDNWIRRASEATAMQGPWDPPVTCTLSLLILGLPLFIAAGCLPPASTETTGTLHPTARGYQEIAGRLVAKMRPDLLPPPPGGPAAAPMFSEVRTSAVAGANGWLTGAAGGQTCGAGAAACVPVQITASVPSSTSLRGLSLSVNGQPLPCPAGGQTTNGTTCRSELTNPQNNTWSLSLTTDGIHRVEATATALNGTRADATYEYKVDLHDPVTASGTLASSAAPAAGWYRTPVDVTLSGTDAAGGSGVQGVEYQLDGGPVTFALDGAKVTLTTDGVHALTGIRPVDWAGRRGPEQPSIVVRLDSTAPAVSVTTPTAGGEYMLNQAVTAAYGCTDGGSGVATCAGPAASGAPLDTASVGGKTFTVNAADAAGNPASATVAYNVGYGVCLVSDPDRAARGGSTVPVVVRVCDASGANLSGAGVEVTAIGVVNATTGQAMPLQSPGNSQPGNRFTFGDGDGDGDGDYRFNLRTTGYQPGRYHLQFTVAGDPLTHVAAFTIR